MYVGVLRCRTLLLPDQPARSQNKAKSQTNVHPRTIATVLDTFIWQGVVRHN